MSNDDILDRLRHQWNGEYDPTGRLLSEAADEIERLRALITELINAAADGGVMYQGITQRWWDAKEALRKAVGR